MKRWKTMAEIAGPTPPGAQWRTPRPWPCLLGSLHTALLPPKQESRTPPPVYKSCVWPWACRDS